MASRLQDVIQRDTRANQPLATDVAEGTLYYVSDESVTERSNGTIWQDCSDGGVATGDVVGPAVAVADRIAVFNGTTGKLIKDGGETVASILASATGINELTGDVVAGPGTGSEVATIANNAVTTAKILNDNVTYAKIQNVSATDRILGRDTAAAGDIEELTVANGIEFTGAAGIRLTTAERTRQIGITIDGAGTEITTGLKGFKSFPVAGTITGVRLLADQTGSIVIDIWKDTYANYPPAVGDTITASAKPTITTAIKSEDTTLTGWTTAVAAGDIFGFNVDSVTDITRVTLELTIVVTG